MKEDFLTAVNSSVTAKFSLLSLLWTRKGAFSIAMEVAQQVTKHESNRAIVLYKKKKKNQL